LAALVAKDNRGRVMSEGVPGRDPDEDFMTYQDFIALTDAELRRRIAAPDPDVGMGYYSIEAYRDELNRRVAERQTRWLIWLTVAIAFLTAVLIAIELGWLRAISGH
jgi:hypothetical protein